MLRAKLGGTLIIGAEGKSAYEIAVKNGFVGTETEWLASLNGKSAYEYAKAGGFTGTEAEFAAKLAGEYIKTVNGVSPDENGNVAVEAGGVTDAEKSLILTLFRNAAYTSPNMADAFAQLEKLWSGGGEEEPDVPDVPDEPVGTTYTITAELVNVTSNNSASSVTEGASYTATLTAADGYKLASVVVTMGGVDVTADVYADGVISIPAVTGNVEIVASATESEAKEPELITDGLVAYFDLRNVDSNSIAVTGSAGGAHGIPTATQGSGSLYSWGNWVSETGDYGTKITRALIIGNENTSTAKTIGNAFTFVGFSNNGGAKSNGLVNFSNILNTTNLDRVARPKYTNTSGGTTLAEQATLGFSSDNNSYNSVAFRLSGKILDVFIDGELKKTWDGADISDFSAWYIENTISGSPYNNPYLTAISLYDKPLTDVEIAEVDAFLRTLEVA